MSREQARYLIAQSIGALVTLLSVLHGSRCRRNMGVFFSNIRRILGPDALAVPAEGERTE